MLRSARMGEERLRDEIESASPALWSALSSLGREVAFPPDIRRVIGWFLIAGGAAIGALSLLGIFMVTA